MKKNLIISVFSLLLLFSSHQRALANHYMGGEITWECTPQGNFRFTMILYRECYYGTGSSAVFPQTLSLQHNVPGLSFIQMNRVSLLDMSPVCSCPGGPNIYCPLPGQGPNMPGSAPNMGAMHENIYTSDLAYPNGVPLTGVPPVTGWWFAYATCCRNNCHNIQNALSLSFFLRAVMYPYQGIPVNTCFDNSPRFLERPSTVICTGYPYTYNHVAFDDDLDSLVYEWAQPLNGLLNLPIVTYYPGYSFNSPLPDTMHNPNNVPATLNPHTGEISFTSYTNGAFVTVTKVTAYKCGIKVAEIFREIQVVLLSCGLNNPPSVTPPFQNSVGQYTLYQDTVYAGQSVNFSISASNLEYCPNTSPPVPQTISLYAVGAQFGTPINQTMCINPPCATLTPTPTWQNPLTGTFGVQTTFNWQTGCQHLATNVGCGSTSNTYNFLFKVMDNFCPAPGIRFATVTIVVLTKPTIPSPPIHCLEVLANGDVVLTWPEVTDTMNTFDSYHVWASPTPTGPFTAIDSIFDITVTTTTHVGAGANNQSVYYYLTVRSGCHGDEMAPPYDTARTIFLTAVNPGPAFGIADLNWNHTHNPLLPGASGSYEIHRDYPAGSWSMVATTPGTSHADVITACSSFVSYRIEMVDTLYNDSTGVVLCRSISNVAGDIFTDVTPPAVPQIHVVTVDQNTLNNRITWNAVPDGDATGYVIYTQTGGVNTFLDTIWDRLDTVYTDLFHDPCNAVYTYVVQSFDSCGNASAMSPPHNNLLVNVVQTPCVEELVITWNPYINMIPSLAGYEVWVIDDHDQVTTLLTTAAPGITSHTHSNLTMGREYCYMIRAVDAGGTKVSEPCRVCYVVSMPNQPDFLYIKTAKVQDNSHIRVLLHTDNTVNVSEYELYRSNDGVNFALIATLPPSPDAGIPYNDFNASFRSQSYYYQAVVIDSCGYVADTSNIARTIYLTIATNQQLRTNTLGWNDYEGFSGAPTVYNVWRSVDGVFEGLPVSAYPPATGNHVDDVGMLTASSGQFTYFIEALEGGGNIYGLTGVKSLSNEVQALMNPNIFIPNAFTPQGTLNNIFKPFNVYVPEGNYEFSVFNRYGQMLFTTTDRNQGWDGTFNNQYVPEGVYVYMVRFVSAAKQELVRRGTVTVIR